VYGLNSDFQKRRVAIYARVSTEHEAQLNALENQVDWYEPILSVRPEWTLISRYIDEGITGTSAEKRPQFMRMINDAKAGKFDLIITREVSRFARNTVDTLQYTRTLKEYGVEVFFITDNIKTFDGDGELRLTIMATLAQDESRKTSVRVKAGQQTSMKNGTFYGNGNILGYDRVGRDLVINPEQAKTVRMIFDLYLSGMGVTSIRYEIEKAGRLTSTGKEKWFDSYISRVLRNTFYCGIITYHKEYVPDYLKQKKIKNTGELEYTRVKGSHTPIVTEEEFERVQQLVEQRSKKITRANNRSQNIGRRPNATVWGRLMVCQCGKHFNAHYHERKDRNSGVDYQCYTSVNRGSRAERIRRGLSVDETCDTPFIPGWKLEMMAKRIFSTYISDADNILGVAYSILERHIADREETADNSDVIDRKNAEIERLREKIANLIEMREDGDIDKEFFRKRKGELDAKIDRLEQDIANLSPQTVQPPVTDFASRLDLLKERLREYVNFQDNGVSESVIEAFIEKIWVAKDEFRWYLRSGDGVTDDNSERMKIAEFTLTIDDAKAYKYAISTRNRVYNWRDLNVSIWI